MSKRYALNKNKFLSHLEQAQLMVVLANHPGRDTLMIELALNTGARATELLNLKLSDINFEAQAVLIHGIKGSDDREIPLHKELFARLSVYAKSQTDTPRAKIFPIGYSRLQAIWYEYRPVKKGFHSLRHTFAMNLYRKTQDLRLLKVALGHRNIANTMIYAEYDYSTTELRRLIL